MPTSATGNRERGFTPVWRSAEHGFTLVELMIVITIIGLTSAAVLLAIPDPQGRLVDEAERFAARAHAVRDLAIIDSRATSVRVTAQGYAFDRRSGGAWRPIDVKPWRSEPWSPGTSAIVGASGEERVSFDSTGLASEPLDINLVRSGERMRVTIAIDGKVQVGG